MTSNMEKIDKISRISPVKLDVNSPWLQRQSRDNQGGQESFKELLNQRIAARHTEVAPVETEAAVWEGNTATQSLFYENGVNLDFFYHQRAGV